MKKYAYKDKTLKLFKGDIPDEWTEVTLEEREVIKKTFTTSTPFEGWEAIKATNVDSTIRDRLEKQNKVLQIKKWFQDTDYIELQAARGTISRESEKYINYLKAYNEKLEELRSIKNE